MQTTIRTGEPRELLALIPFQLGFQPTESAVVVSLRTARSRVGLVARVDLADLADADDGRQVARSLVSHLVGDGARRAVLVVYTAAGAAEADGVASRAQAHLQEAAEHFLGEVACWVVGPTGYRSLGCADPACCPPEGRPLTDLQGTAVGAHMVLGGARVAGSRDEVARIAPAPAASRRSAARAAARWAAQMPAGAGSPMHRWRRSGLTLWRTELGRACVELAPAVQEGTAVGRGAGRGPATWEAPEATVVGRIRAALDDVLVRDAVMVGFVPGTDQVADGLIAEDAGADVGGALRAIVDPEVGRAPDPVLHAAARAVLEDVVAHTVRRSQAPALTLLAVLAWWEGDGARAGVLVERALAVSPGYRLAVLIEETLRAGMPPGWLRVPRD